MRPTWSRRTLTFDVVTEMAWDDRAGFETWITCLGAPAVAEDEARFLDRSRTPRQQPPHPAALILAHQ